MPQPLPNLHHLELFYHVASSGGITAATRSMPYGIQQPAVSGQLTQLESELGVRLFQRRPFKLTPAGEQLYAFVVPFFSKLAEVAASVAGKASRQLRIAAPAMVIREHLPAVVAAVRKKVPDLELSLVEARQREIETLLEKEMVDLAVTELEEKPSAGNRSEELASLPMVLLVPAAWKLTQLSLPKLAATTALIRPPMDAAVTRLFFKGLGKLRLAWPAKIEASTIELVQTYVAHGFGVGVSVRVPGITISKDIQMFELKNFPPLVIAALWRGKLHPLAEEVLIGLRKIAMPARR